MIVTEFLLFMFLILVIRYFWGKRRLFYLAKKIPSSSYENSIQSFYQMITADNKTVFKAMCDSFGNNQSCTKSWFGLKLFVGLVRPDDIQTVLNSKECFDKPRFVKFINLLQGTLFGNLQYWYSHRRIINPYFGVQSLKSIVEIFNTNSKILLENFAVMEGKGEFNVLYPIAAFTLETIVNVMEYDVNIQRQEKEARDVYMHNLESFTKVISIRAFKPWFYPDFIYKHTKLYKKEVESKSKTALSLANKICQNAQELIKANGNGYQKPKTFIRALLNSKNNLTSSEIHDEIATFMLAAQDTSGIVSSSVILLLAMHKNIQQKVVGELRNVFGDTINPPYINYEKLDELIYLEMVINEAMRLMPVVPFVFRVNSEETQISNDIIIPVGTTIIIPIYLLHRSKEIWGADADKFKPERFEKENFEKMHPYSFIPFIKGPRMCIGWRYAMILMKIQLSNILLRNEFDTHLKFEDLEYGISITLNLCQGYMVSVKQRKIADGHS